MESCDGGGSEGPLSHPAGESARYCPLPRDRRAARRRPKPRRGPTRASTRHGHQRPKGRRRPRRGWLIHTTKTHGGRPPALHRRLPLGRVQQGCHVCASDHIEADRRLLPNAVDVERREDDPVGEGALRGSAAAARELSAGSSTSKPAGKPPSPYLTPRNPNSWLYRGKSCWREVLAGLQ